MCLNQKKSICKQLTIRVVDLIVLHIFPMQMKGSETKNVRVTPGVHKFAKNLGGT
jgi:hypothetical protein